MKAICPPGRHLDAPIARGRDQRILYAASLYFTLLILVWSPNARADGGFVSHHGHDVWEPEQKALILYDAATQTEELIIQPSFVAYSPDFAWIVPVPSLPQLGAADGRLFFECSDLTRPLSRRKSRGDCSSYAPVYAPPPTDVGVSIYDTQRVGIFDTMTVGADDARVLTDSLDTWGFLHHANRAAVEAALQFYIEKSWFFVAMKTDSASFWERPTHLDPWRGGIDPVRLTFTTPEIVYPMRVSAISAGEWTEVLIYVCSDHRMTYAGAVTEYAHQISAEELPAIRAAHENLGPLLAHPCFMTKLRRTFTPEEMTGDIVLARADNDHEFRLGRYQYDVSLGGGLVMLVAWLLLTGARRRGRMPGAAGA